MYLKIKDFAKMKYFKNNNGAENALKSLCNGE